MVNPFRRLLNLLRRVMRSRKRKTDMESDVPIQADDLNNSDLDNSGDGTGYPPPKKRTPKLSLDQSHPCAIGDYDIHKFIAYIGPIVCDNQGVCISLDNYRTDISTHQQLVFNCPYGDCWDDRLHCNKTKNTVSTDTPGVDIILKQMEGQGFEARQHLHSGRFGSVVLTYSTQEGRLVVLKFPNTARSCKLHRLLFPTQLRETSRSTEEIPIHSQLRHPNIVEFLTFQDIDGQKIIHLEYCENGNLEQLLISHVGFIISEGAARKFFRDLIEGLEFIHHQCFVHLDIRPKNLLISRYHRLKIADFGDAGYFQVNDALYRRRIGISGYKAPENMYRFNSYNPRLVDIWGIGCVLFRMVGGRPPFLPIHRATALDLIKKGLDEEFARSTTLFSQALQALLHKMLQFAPESRGSLTSIKLDDWVVNKSTNVHISGAYMTQHIQKRAAGLEELQMKQDHFI